MKSNQGGCHHEKQNRLCKSGMERTALAGCVQSDGSSKGCFVGAVRICGGTGQHDDGRSRLLVLLCALQFRKATCFRLHLVQQQAAFCSPIFPSLAGPTPLP